ncbi:tetratricopeptide repeat protein [Nostoc sp. UHCC 0702]|nr:tetratricopeptide repeat protein [Nostoc sp. UHCC 0702]
MLADILAQLQKQASAGESGVAAAFELNWQSLEPEAQKLACLLSLFALAPIPWSLVESAASYSDWEFDLKANCTILVERYLLQELAEDTYQIHDLIRELLQQKLEDLAEADELKRGYCQAMVGIAQDIPQTPTLIEIAQVTLAIPHLAGTATVYQDWLSDDDLIWPFVGLARFYQGQGAYEQALPWYEQSLSAARKRFGDEHPDVAASLNNLAALYRSQGRYSEAEALYIDALSMTKRLLGDEHPSVATSLNNLALLYDSQGRYSEAEALYIEALKIAEKQLGVNHPNTITIRENLEYLRRNRQP